MIFAENMWFSEIIQKVEHISKHAGSHNWWKWWNSSISLKYWGTHQKSLNFMKFGELHQISWNLVKNALLPPRLRMSVKTNAKSMVLGWIPQKSQIFGDLPILVIFMKFHKFHVLGENRTFSHFSRILVPQVGPRWRGESGIPDRLRYSAGIKARGGKAPNLSRSGFGCAFFPHSNIHGGRDGLSRESQRFIENAGKQWKHKRFYYSVGII